MNRKCAEVYGHPRRHQREVARSKFGRGVNLVGAPYNFLELIEGPRG